MTKLRILDLFSGIGGFSLGLERTGGFETVAFCEIEKYPRQILAKHWPDTPVFEDVRKLTSDGLGSIDVICGGYPCQPFSAAGQRRGDQDDRHLWPEMFRLIKELRPTWVIAENVAGHISMGLDQVLVDLESENYTCQTFVIPACATGAIHRRDRVWIIAYAHDQQCEGRTLYKMRDLEKRESHTDKPDDWDNIRSGVAASHDGFTTHTCRAGLQGSEQQEASFEKARASRSIAQSNYAGMYENRRFRSIELPIESPLRHRNDGLPNQLARLRALGNAVVPQIPEMIGYAILATR